MVLDRNTFARQSSDYRQAVAALARCLHGRLIEPGDPEYDEARRVWNGTVDRYPALVVRAADVADVLSAVNFARQQGLELAIRSGGHSLAGAGTSNGGLVLDLSGMKTMTVDLERRTARVDTGLTFGEVSERLQEYGLAIPAGDTASVGVGGLTLGGGIGWLVRKYGLTIDSLLSAEIVTADGRLLTASADENPDLFWAIRGGGGNFGVVTSFEFRVHRAGMVVGGAIIYDAADGEQVLRGYADFAAQAPDELSTIVFMMAAPPLPFIPPEKHGKPIILITLVHVGDLEEGQRVVQPLRELGTPIADISGPMPYAAMYQLTAEGSVRGRQSAHRSMYHREMDDAMVETVMAFVRTISQPGVIAQLRVLGGAMARVPDEATAFAHRDARMMFTIISGWEDPAEGPARHAWVNAFWRAIRPYSAGVYVNFLEDEGAERVREAYKPATYERLVAIKNRYDPTNFFHLNQNIVPTR